MTSTWTSSRYLLVSKCVYHTFLIEVRGLLRAVLAIVESVN